MKEPKLPWKRMALYFPVSLLCSACGLLILIYALELIPLGLFLWWLAAYPYARWLSKKIHADIAYAERDHAMVDGDLEWETPDEVDFELMNIIINGTGRGSSND